VTRAGRQPRWTVAAAALGLLAGLAAPRPALGQAGSRPLVMPFQASTTESRADWLGELAAVAITRELRAASVPAIRRDDRLQAMERLRVPDVPLLSHATVLRLGSAVGATVIVVGRIEVMGVDLVLRARPIRVDTGFMAAEIVERGPRAGLFDIAARIGQQVAGAAAPNAATIAARPPVAAFELFVRGLVASNPATRIALLSDALEQAPRLDDARFALWDAHTEQGEHQRARTAVNVALVAGDTRRAAFLGAVSELQLGRYQEALTGFSALQRAHADAALANNMGVVQLRRPGSGPKATDLFREGTTLDPNDPDLFFNLGYAHWIAREYPQAVEALREAVRRNPADDDAHYVLGAALQASGSTEEGAREKDLARRLSSVYSDLDASRAANSVPRGLERLKTAIDAASLARVESALSAAGQREQRELVSFYLTNGRRLFQSERDADALAELRRAVFLSPYESDAHLLIGRILLRGGRPREAIDTLKISVWSRDTPAARLALAEAYVAARDYAAARIEVQAVLTAEPGNAAAAALLAALPPP
jgi:tetratricopeptide (TPR) repeat protein